MYDRERAVIMKHQNLLARIRVRILRFADEQWRGLGSWRDADIDRFAALIIPVVESGEMQVGQLTNAYLDSMARLAGVTPAPAAAPVTGAALRNGTAVAEVYRRPATTLYTALSDGMTIDQAVELGAQRLADIISTDLQLAQTHTAQARALADERIDYTKRVLTGAENCLLCTLAASQRYSKRDLLPIHPGCDCTVEHVYGGSMAASDAINEEIYERAMSAQGTAEILDTHSGPGLVKKSRATKRKYNDQRTATNLIITNNHGEYGPTLAWRDQHFTGPDDL